MRERGYGALVWGGLLILLGLLLLIDNLELMGDWDVPVLSLMLGALGMIFLAIFVNDRAQWWALIPGLVILGIAVAVFMAERDLVPDYAVATIILAGVGLPFLLVFFADRQHWWGLIPAMTMGGIALGIFFEGTGVIDGEVVGAFVVGGISLGFLSIYLIDRKQWWALIPGGAMGIVTLFLLLATATQYVVPVVMILLGLLLLRGSLGGGRRRAGRAASASAPRPSGSVRKRSIDEPGLANHAVKEVIPERKRLPTLEEQIEAAIAEEPEIGENEGVDVSEPEEPAPPTETPSPPEIPDPPQVPPPPEMQ